MRVRAGVQVDSTRGETERKGVRERERERERAKERIERKYDGWGKLHTNPCIQPD